MLHFLPARRYASAVYAMSCLFVCVSLTKSQVGILSKQLIISSHKQRRTIA